MVSFRALLSPLMILALATATMTAPGPALALISEEAMAAPGADQEWSAPEDDESDAAEFARAESMAFGAVAVEAWNSSRSTREAGAVSGATGTDDGASPQGARATTEEIYSGLASTGGTQYLVVREEDHAWVAEHYSVGGDGWQTRVARSVWPSRRGARAAAQAVVRELRQVKRLNSEPVGAELRTQVNGQVIWPTRQEWSWQWEIRYGAWVKEQVSTEFFNKHQLATDCADVAFALRWIFARSHGLPAANRLAATGRLFTNESLRAEWARLPTGGEWHQDRRFLAALNYLLDNSYTHTLLRDSYPVQISRDGLFEGAHYLETWEGSGHTRFVLKASYEDGYSLPLTVIASTVPRTVRSLYEDYFWQYRQPEASSGGFMRLRWAVRKSGGFDLVAPGDMPFHSIEQFAPEFMGGRATFAEAVLLRLKPHLNLVEWLKAGIGAFADQVRARQEIVEKGHQFCQAHPCEPGSANHEAWSTPSRDKRLLELLGQMGMIVQLGGSDELRLAWQDAQARVILHLREVPFSLAAVSYVWTNHGYSSEPADPVHRRWGLSGLGAAENLQAAVGARLRDRQFKIERQGERCVGSSACGPGTESWQAWNTLETDQELGRLRAYDLGFCKSVSVSCAEFLQARAQVRIGEGDLAAPLTEWMERIPWLNSDPRHAPAIRWGGMRERTHWHDGKSARPLVIGASGWALLDRDGQNALVDLVARGEKAAPNGYAWAALNEPGTWGVAANAAAGEIGFLKTGEGRWWVLRGVAGRPEFVEGDRLLVWDVGAGNVAVIDLKDQPKFVASVPFKSARRARASGTEYFLEDAQGMWWLHDFSEFGGRHRLPALEPQEVYGTVTAETERHVLVALGCRGASQKVPACVRTRSLLINKHSGVTAFREDLVGVVHVSASGRTGLQFADGKGWYVEFDEILRILERRELGVDPEMAGPWVVAGFIGKRDLYRWQGDGLEKVALPEGEGLYGLVNDYILTRAERNLVRVRRYGDATVLLESRFVEPVRTSDGRPWFLMRETWGGSALLLDLDHSEQMSVLTGDIAQAWTDGSGGSESETLPGGGVQSGPVGTWWLDKDRAARDKSEKSTQGKESAISRGTLVFISGGTPLWLDWKDAR